MVNALLEKDFWGWVSNENEESTKTQRNDVFYYVENYEEYFIEQVLIGRQIAVRGFSSFLVCTMYM